MLLYYFKPLYRPNVQAIYPWQEPEKPKRKKRKKYDEPKPEAAHLVEEPILEAVVAQIETRAREALAPPARQVRERRVRDVLNLAGLDDLVSQMDRRNREFMELIILLSGHD